VISYDESQCCIDALDLGGTRESISLLAAAGRVCADDVCLLRDQPGFDRSTMDGYAIALDGERESFAVIGAVHAGETASVTPQPGQAIKIMTGAPCPASLTVVPIECTDGGTETVRVTDHSRLAPGRNIAWQGEDGRAGSVVVSAGTLLTAPVLSVAAMAGHAEVATWRPPTVAVVTTGDEVGADGVAGIADSNGPLLQALLSELGVGVSHHHARDEAGGLRAVLAKALADHEVVVTTGGVSAGDRDLVPGTAEELGYATVFHKVAIQPGKPVFLAQREQRCLIGLPGNPVSVLATAHLFLLPLLGRYLGGWRPQWLQLPVAQALTHLKPRELFQPAILTPKGLEPVAWNGSGDLLAAASADGLMRLVPNVAKRAGERIRFLPFGGRFGTRSRMPERGA
jgi:molybdopterin molybdotransferase